MAARELKRPVGGYGSQEDLPTLGSTGMTSIKLALLVAMSVAAVTAFASPAAAIEYPWCVAYSGMGGGGKNCGFSTYEQCRVSAMGTGYCEANTFYDGPAERPARRARHGKHHNG